MFSISVCVLCYMCVCGGDCGDDVFHFGHVTLEALAAPNLPWARSLGQRVAPQ